MAPGKRISDGVGGQSMGSETTAFEQRFSIFSLIFDLRFDV